MSGGSYNYVYRQVEEIEVRPTTPLRRAFAAHLRKVAKALHDLEWVDSDDYAPGYEEDAIRACLGPGAELAQLVAEAEDARKALDAALKQVS